MCCCWMVSVLARSEQPPSLYPPWSLSLERACQGRSPWGALRTVRESRGALQDVHICLTVPESVKTKTLRPFSGLTGQMCSPISTRTVLTQASPQPHPSLSPLFKLQLWTSPGSLKGREKRMQLHIRANGGSGVSKARHAKRKGPVVV